MLNYLITSNVSLYQTIFRHVQEYNSKGLAFMSFFVIFSYALTTECISADCCFYYTKCQFKLSKCLLLKFVQILVILLQDTLSVRCTNWILSAPLVITCSNSI